MSARHGRRQDRRGIGADRDETRDADIEEAGLPPLQVEAERQDRKLSAVARKKDP
jgi:hypothetical protein